MNSLLYFAENNYNEDFLYMLIFEYFSFLSYDNKKCKFEDFIQKKMKLDNAKIEELNDNDKDIIKKSVEKIKTLFSDKTDKISLKNKRIDKVMQKLFFFHKKKQLKFNHQMIPIKRIILKIILKINIFSIQLKFQ